MNLNPSKFTIRKRLLVLFIITVVVVGVSLYVISREIVQTSYKKLENKDIETNFQNILSNINSDIDSLGILVTDWASWDDTYRFIDDLNPEYINSNLIDETFQGINLNVMMFIRTDGSIAYQKTYDTKTQKEIPLYPDLRELLETDKNLTIHETEEAVKKGIIVLKNGPMIIVSRPILTSEKKGPIAGALIMGRLIDFRSLIKEVHLISYKAFSVYPIDSTEIPKDFKTQLTNDNKAGIYIKPVDNNLVTGYSPIIGIQDKPVLVLKLEMTRDIFQQGLSTTNYLILLLIIVALIFAFIALYVTNKSILTPLYSISKEIQEIGLSSDMSKRLKYSGKDEFTDLSTQFNLMMDSLERTQDLLKESERRYTNLYNKMSEGVYRTSPQGEILSANPALMEMLGYDEDEIYKIDIQETSYIDPRDRQIWQRQIEEIGETRGIELNLKRKDGQRIIALENSWVVKDSKGKVVCYEGTLVDITQRKTAEIELIMKAKFEEIIMDISTSFVSTPTDKIDEVINTSLSKIGNFAEVDRGYLFLFSADRLNINNTHEWCREGIEKVIHLKKDLPVNLVSWSIEKILNLQNSVIDDVSRMPPEARTEKYIWDSQDIKSLLLVPIQSAGNVIGFLGFDSVRFLREWQQNDTDLLKIIGELFGYALNRKKTEYELKYLSLHDSLTNLYNRTYYDEEVQRLDKGRITRIGIIVCDLDGLKLTNDTIGHKAGDILIKKAAQALKMSFRKEDVVARIGGDEFAILLPHCDREAVEKACNRLRESVEKIKREKFILPLSISIGYAAREDTSTSINDLFKLADEMMYQDKKSHIETVYPLIKQALKSISISDINHF